MARGRILPLPSDKLRRAEARGEARGSHERQIAITKDIDTIGPLLRDRKTDLEIIEQTGWEQEKIDLYRDMLKPVL